MERHRGPDTDALTEQAAEDFTGLVRYTLAGYVAGLLAAGVFDGVGWQRSAWGQWLVRTLAGEGESVLEGVYAVRARIAGRVGSMAQAYGWGKLVGMTVPWVIDLSSRLAGVDVYGIEGFYIPFFYAMADQIGGNLSGLWFLRRRAPSWRAALGHYLRHPVMMAGLALILGVPVGLLTARLLGFSPTTQIRTALETVVANLCWLPPLLGWVAERRRRVAP